MLGRVEFLIAVKRSGRSLGCTAVLYEKLYEIHHHLDQQRAFWCAVPAAVVIVVVVAVIIAIVLVRFFISFHNFFFLLFFIFSLAGTWSFFVNNIRYTQHHTVKMYDS